MCQLTSQNVYDRPSYRLLLGGPTNSILPLVIDAPVTSQLICPCTHSNDAPVYAGMVISDQFPPFPTRLHSHQRVACMVKSRENGYDESRNDNS
ncbi:hypothetical protein Y032_0039g23 [Ancylostoma ceylanicum]|uniref:Uncharacterized protein n=1 Tax=Ancylostoma ceylanicum TaxID=53326 RepID=A0A016UIT8_9BILA|nr:hypothetical protein Y032_0039g23 [Ancylostoma ceylanicum]